MKNVTTLKMAKRKLIARRIKQNKEKKLKDSIRPRCQFTPGCTGLAQNQNTAKDPRWRKSRNSEGKLLHICGSCHVNNYMSKPTFGKKKKNKNKNPINAYRKYKKDYCENRNGDFLGFECTYTHPSKKELEVLGLSENYKGFLQVDHIDGNPSNNKPSNLITLCANCHNIKTIAAGDYATKGRKKLKIA